MPLVMKSANQGNNRKNLRATASAAAFAAMVRHPQVLLFDFRFGQNLFRTNRQVELSPLPYRFPYSPGLKTV
jgi:hypothetical protein